MLNQISDIEESAVKRDLRKLRQYGLEKLQTSVNQEVRIGVCFGIVNFGRQKMITKQIFSNTHVL